MQHLIDIVQQFQSWTETSFEVPPRKFKNLQCVSQATVLNNTHKSSWSSWSLIKIFVSNKKVQLIPYLYLENRFIADFKEMAELFNCFFSKQCPVLANHSKFSTSLSFRTDKRFSVEDIGKIIQDIDHNKAHRPQF